MRVFVRNKTISLVPSSVNERVIRVLRLRKGWTREHLMVLAAQQLISHYISFEMANEFWEGLAPRDERHMFLGFARILEAGQFVMSTLSHDNASEWFRRLARETPKKALVEIKAAQYFERRGYKVSIRPEIGVRGLDFDFKISNEVAEFNVEVTELEGPTFTPQNLKNSLDDKRSQLPPGQPNIFYCNLPWGWIEKDFETWLPLAIDVVRRFLRGTTRISVVMLAVESYSNKPGSVPANSFLCIPIPNDRALSPVDPESLTLGRKTDWFLRVSNGFRRPIFESWFDQLLWTAQGDEAIQTD